MAALLGIALGGCQTSQVVSNAPLPVDQHGQPAYSGGYGLPTMLSAAHGDMFTALTFSGGGKRSAAFAHGALRGLRDIPTEAAATGGPGTMLDAVDYIAAVSGGSFAAAQLPEVQHQRLHLGNLLAAVELGVAGQPALRKQ
ncbi:MAG: hypothetical protein M3Y41_20690 [Pseudomonadota bacterium]|nr:hypothetical protein [Pseudomonadota bacterium]